MAFNPGEPDSVQLLLLHCNSVLKEARFILHSLPLAEDASVERILRQMHAIHQILEELSDPWLTQGEISCLISLILEVASPLQNWLDRIKTKYHPPSIPQINGAGRPHYKIDLDRAIELHDMELTWEQIAQSMGVSRRTLYYHLTAEGRSTKRKLYTDISDDDLNCLIADLAKKHPLSGSVILRGHLESLGVHIPLERVRESLRKVDVIGVNLRWNGAIKRRVYRVRGSNALWHQDGNEKLRPWGFYVHGCIDGHSRLAIYLMCSNNKRSKTVESHFMHSVGIYGWPSRVRGDFGTENNGIEMQMIRQWGVLHHAYLRGRSIHNVRIERFWRDVRKDTLEFFRTLFIHLENIGLLNMELDVHRICLFLVFHKRIQHSLDETVASWNTHKIRTAGNKSPMALYQLSREHAINHGYWTGDPGDNLEDVTPLYGTDPNESFPPSNELETDPTTPSYQEYMDKESERNAGLFVNEDEEIEAAKICLEEMDLNGQDGNFGIDIYLTAVARLTAIMAGEL